MTDAFNYTEAECEAAMCIWEEVLARRAGDFPTDPIIRFFEKHGAAETRQHCMELARPIDVAYNAIKDDYGDPFDWEFVPAMLTLLSMYFSEDTLSITKEVAVIVAKANFSD